MTELAEFIKAWILNRCDAAAADPEWVVFEDREGFSVQDLADAITDEYRIEKDPIK